MAERLRDSSQPASEAARQTVSQGPCSQAISQSQPHMQSLLESSSFPLAHSTFAYLSSPVCLCDPKLVCVFAKIQSQMISSHSQLHDGIVLQERALMASHVGSVASQSEQAAAVSASHADKPLSYVSFVPLQTYRPHISKCEMRGFGPSQKVCCICDLNVVWRLA